MRIGLLVYLLIFTMTASAQSAIERIGTAINQNDLFTLQREYEKGRDSLPGMIDAIARVILGGHFNNMELSHQLVCSIEKVGENLGMDQLVSLVTLISHQLHRQNQNDKVVDFLDHMLIALKDHPRYCEALKIQKERYMKYCGYSLYRIKNSSMKEVSVPLHIDSVGVGGLVFTFQGEVNGSSVRYIFDTGATVNVISREFSKRYQFTSLHDTMSFAGDFPNEMVLVDSINIGGLVVYNVPFCIMDLSTGEKKIDQHFNQISVIFGLPLLSALKEVQLDLKQQQLIFPVKLTARSLPYSNIYWEPSGYITLETKHKGEQMLFYLDSGCTCSTLAPEYFVKNRERFQATGKIDSIGFAGVGGIVHSAYYLETDFQVELADREVFAPKVMAAENSNFKQFSTNRGIFGADLFMIYSKVILNMKDMFMQVETK